ncbi:TPA: hypothetical protein NV714_000112 [Escherichia coli]|nr:hypothetical protein [Escherichia coli]
MKKLKEWFINFVSQFIRFFIFSKIYVKKNKTKQFKESPVIYICNQSNHYIDYLLYNKFDTNSVFILSKKKFINHFIINKEYLKYDKDESFKKVLKTLKKENIFLFLEEENTFNEDICSLINFLLKEKKELKIIPLSVCYDDLNTWRSHAYIIEGDPFILENEDSSLTNQELQSVILDYLDDISLNNDSLKNKIEKIAYFSTFNSPKEYSNYLFNIKKSDSELINNIYNEIENINKEIEYSQIEQYKNLPIINFHKKFHFISDFHYILLFIICLFGFILNLPFIFIQEKIITRFFKSNIQFFRGLISLFFITIISFTIFIESSFGSLLIYLILSFISLKYSRFSYFKVASFLNDRYIPNSLKTKFLKLKYNTFIKFLM